MPLSPAYVAGFIDGEGCIQIVRQRKVDRFSWAHVLSISVHHTYGEILDKLHQQYGGVRCSPSVTKETNRTVHIWRLTGNRVGPFLREILPFLHEKRAQALTALDYLEKRTPSQAGKRVTQAEIDLRDSFYWKLRQLKRPYL